MTLWRRVIQHLLPRGAAWRAFPGSTLDKFLSGLSSLPGSVRQALDKLWSDIIPETTRHLSDWESQFALRPRSLTDAERRQRLRARWAATGGQSKAYIQGVLRDAGYPVTVYEWFIPPAQKSTVQGLDAGGVLALDDGTVLEINPYPPGNAAWEPEIVLGGEAPQWRCGVPGARCGVYGADNRQVRILSVDGGVLEISDGALSVTGYYTVRAGSFIADGYILQNRGLDDAVYPDPPQDPSKWPYVLYIGGEPFQTPAMIPSDRRDDFEQLLLEICPSQQWLGMIVIYT